MLGKLFGSRKNSSSQPGTDTDFNPEIFWIQPELEFRHQAKELRFRSSEQYPLKFGEVINRLFGIRKNELNVLTINDGTLTTIDDPDAIWNYEFLGMYKLNKDGVCDYYVEGCSKLMNQIVLSLSYKTLDKRKNDVDQSISKVDAMLIAHLQYPLGANNTVCYVQTTFLLPTIRLERSKKGINPLPHSLSILIGVDYRPQEVTDQEFDEVYESLKRKLKSGKFDELDYLERVIVDTINHPVIAKEIYTGKAVMREHRYWDAIEYFLNAFKALQERWWNKEFKDEDKRILLECSYCIGYCYFELGLHEKAYRYLELPANLTTNHKYISEFINCLIELRDVRSIEYIEKYSDILSGKDKEMWSDEDHKFFMFLIRRKAFCLIDLKEYDQAAEILNFILHVDPYNEFAQNELKYIRSMQAGGDR